MFGIESGELIVIMIVTILVIGPKELPRVLYKIGQIMGKIQGVTRHFRSGLDAMVREVELEELEKKWAADNKRIMAENPDVYDTATLVGAEDVTPAAGEPPAGDPAQSTDDMPVQKFETPDYVVDVETLPEELRPPRSEAAE